MRCSWRDDNSLFGTGIEIKGNQPLAERNVAVLKNRSDGRRELFAALSAFDADRRGFSFFRWLRFSKWTLQPCSCNADRPGRSASELIPNMRGHLHRWRTAA